MESLESWNHLESLESLDSLTQARLVSTMSGLLIHHL